MGTRLRLADLLGGLSIACDLGSGLPAEEAMRSCLVATALARRCGLPEPVVSDTYYTALLFHVGCSALSHEAAAAWGDERRMVRAAVETNVADPEDVARRLVPALTAGLGPADRDRVLRFAASPPGQTFGHRFDTGTCEVASATARRVGLGPGVERALAEAVEWWNGHGPPKGLQGEEIAVAGRIARVAGDAARFDHLGGTEAVAVALRRRAGGVLDPSLVETMVAQADDLLADARTGDPRQRLLEVEPEPVVELGQDDLDRVATAFGDLADLKTPWTHGHSEAVTRLVSAAARTLRVDTQSTVRLRLAARLQDLGRVAVTNLVWEKAGPLTSADWEQARMHSYHSERILVASEALAPLARMAGMHHERLDGSGYYRGCTARDVPAPVRILAAADAFHAMTQPRPHRAALSVEQAAATVRDEVRAGRLDGEAATAVLEAAGAVRPRRRHDQRPGGLSEREVEVTRLVAAGCSNPEIAQRLVISRRTAEHHVQHIYAKTGVSSRAGLALFAHEHGLISPADPR